MILAKPVKTSEISADGYCSDEIAATALGVSTRTLRRLGQNGKIPRKPFTVRGGTSYLYKLDNAAIARYTALHLQPTTTTPTLYPSNKKTMIRVSAETYIDLLEFKVATLEAQISKSTTAGQA